MENTTAVWDVSLNCECPNCYKYVNLLDYCDFWDGRKFDISEYDTERSRNVEVMCPECEHDFIVDLAY